MTDAILRAEGITKAYDGVTIIQDVSLHLDRGELVCVLGVSGAGKTTLFHVLSGLSAPEAGHVYLENEEITGRPGQVSYMLQKDLLLQSRTILDNACLPLVIGGMRPAEAREKARPLLERFGLAGVEDKWPSQLSGGMRQRAAFLRTYLMGNDVALLDEPFSALDALTRADIRSWYASTASELGMASVVITHDVDEAVIMATRVYVLEGDPRGGIPSTIAGEVPINHQTEGAFDLSLEFINAKREVLTLLG